MTSPVQYLNAVAVDEDVLSALSQLPFSKTGTRRICLHSAQDAPLHVMVVESKASEQFPPHCHSDSDEFSTVVTGVLELMVWDRGADQKPSIIRIGQEPGLAKATFVPRGTVHITRAVGRNCIYIEVKLGPFDKNAMIMSSESELMTPN
jgi:cupin fold WbuC family metalloprotein